MYIFKTKISNTQKENMYPFIFIHKSISENVRLNKQYKTVDEAGNVFRYEKGFEDKGKNYQISDNRKEIKIVEGYVEAFNNLKILKADEIHNKILVQTESGQKVELGIEIDFVYYKYQVANTLYYIHIQFKYDREKNRYVYNDKFSKTYNVDIGTNNNLMKLADIINLPFEMWDLIFDSVANDKLSTISKMQQITNQVSVREYDYQVEIDAKEGDCFYKNNAIKNKIEIRRAKGEVNISQAYAHKLVIEKSKINDIIINKTVTNLELYNNVDVDINSILRQSDKWNEIVLLRNEKIYEVDTIRCKRLIIENSNIKAKEIIVSEDVNIYREDWKEMLKVDVDMIEGKKEVSIDSIEGQINKIKYSKKCRLRNMKIKGEMNIEYLINTKILLLDDKTINESKLEIYSGIAGTKENPIVINYDGFKIEIRLDNVRNVVFNISQKHTREIEGTRKFRIHIDKPNEEDRTKSAKELLQKYNIKFSTKEKNLRAEITE